MSWEQILLALVLGGLGGWVIGRLYGKWLRR